MIQANELRIGNLVLAKPIFGNNKTPTIVTVSKYEIYRCADNPNHFNGIPLTEEWLLKFGFEKKLDKFSLKNKKSGVFRFAKISSGIIVGELEHGRYSISEFIKYVHQLQNIYFALTGEEITIKE